MLREIQIRHRNFAATILLSSRSSSAYHYMVSLPCQRLHHVWFIALRQVS